MGGSQDRPTGALVGRLEDSAPADSFAGAGVHHIAVARIEDQRSDRKICHEIVAWQPGLAAIFAEPHATGYGPRIQSVAVVGIEGERTNSAADIAGPDAFPGRRTQIRGAGNTLAHGPDLFMCPEPVFSIEFLVRTQLLQTAKCLRIARITLSGPHQFLQQLLQARLRHATDIGRMDALFLFQPCPGLICQAVNKCPVAWLEYRAAMIAACIAYQRRGYKNEQQSGNGAVGAIGTHYQEFSCPAFAVHEYAA